MVAKYQNYFLAFVILALVALRFTWTGDTVFINDEPAFQARIDQHFQEGSIPLTSFRGSSIALPYGAGALWVYMLIRQVSSDPLVIVFFHILLVSLSIPILFYVLKKNFGLEAALWTILLAASSPLLFFFSRHSWDNTFFVPLGACLLSAISLLSWNKLSFNRELVLHALVGLLLAYGLNIHLMFGPVVLAGALFLLYRGLVIYGLRSKYFYAPLFCAALIFLLVVFPYLQEALSLASQEQALEQNKFKERWGDGRNLWWLFQRSTIFASLWGSNIYLQEVKQDFFLFCGPILTKIFRIDVFGWLPKMAAWFGAFYVLKSFFPFPFVSTKSLKDKPNVLLVFSALCFFSLVLVFQYLNIPTAPHYFHPIWFFIFVGVAWALANIQKPWGKKALKYSLFFCVCINIVYILMARQFVHENKGARTMLYSVALSEQKRAVAELCIRAKERNLSLVKLDMADTFWSPFIFWYLPKQIPACEGLTIEAARNLPEANFVASHPIDSRTKADLVIRAK